MTMTVRTLTIEPDDGAELPLVLVTVGGDDDEFMALNQHLDEIAHVAEPGFQSLVVARPDMPKMMYNVLRARIKPMKHVYIRRLNEAPENCSERLHESGTFLVTKASGEGKG